MPCQEESCHSNNISVSQSRANQLQTPLQKSLSSQQSLPSVPSLTTRIKEKHLNGLNTQYHCLATLKGHTSYISSLIVSGKFLYSGSSDREIRFWKRGSIDSNSDDHHDISDNVVAVGKGTVKSLVVLSDKLFTAHQDHKIRVWKIGNDGDDNHHEKYARLATLPTLSDRATKLLLPKNYVRVRRHKKSTWVHHVDTVSSLALSKDGSLLYSVSWDRSLKIWRTSDFRCLESISNAHDDAINAVASSSDGYVYTGSTDRKIKMWRKLPGEKKHSLVATLEKHNSGINALALSSDGCSLYSGACDRSILVWQREADEEDGQMVVVGALRGHTKSILCLAVVSNLICSGSADKTVRIWSGMDRRYSCLAVLEGHQGPVKSLTATIDYHNHRQESSSSTYVIYSGGLDCYIKVWQVSIPLIP